MSLIIVESPTKARTFNRILKDKDYFVYATMGHFRDLPTKKISIDYKKDFKPNYQIIGNKTKIVEKLKELASQYKEIILATDPDREGESISYHAAYVLGFIKENWPEFTTHKTLKRIVFHEITAKALSEALANPSTIREDLVKAQQARRILDRVVGYELSPLLWKKMGKNWLSAGRVQTVALRLIVEREKEINKFKAEKYHQIYGNFSSNLKTQNFSNVRAKLISKDGLIYEVKNKISLFDGEYSFTKTIIDSQLAEAIIKELKIDQFHVNQINEETVKRYPPPPLTTSLLQQEAFKRYGFSSKLTMRLAQNLYEQGLITYHRTDSFQMASYFVFKAKDYIAAKYGKDYALDKPRGYLTKSKNAQEAHEAIRPTSLDKEPDKLSTGKSLTINHKRLYELIFIRAVCTQMKEAEIKQIKIFIKSNKEYLFLSEIERVIFDGFLKLLNPGFVERTNQALRLRSGLIKNDKLNLKDYEDKELDTQAPPRYNEASLIKTMEEKGIGRPSTYAPIISLIQDKYYVEKERRYFLPTKLGTMISDYLSKSFKDLFDLNFTAKLEDSLDLVANGQENFITTLKDFYLNFKKELNISKKDKSVIDVEEKFEEKCEKCGSDLVLRFSKYGKFLGCSKYPKCRYIKPFLYFAKDQFCPKCKGKVVIKFSKARKKFYGCENYPKCDYSAWKLNWSKPQEKPQKSDAG